MTEALRWTIETAESQTVVHVSGFLSEDADLSALAERLKTEDRVRLELSAIGHINSCGVREWVNFVRSLPGTSEIVLEKCSPAFVAQINMISNFAGSARILSVHAPFVCDGCGAEESVLVEIEPGQQPSLAEINCPECGEAMEFDDIEESYFAFVG